MRSADDVADRTLALNAVLAAVHGVERAEALAWTEQVGCAAALTGDERTYLRRGSPGRELMLWRVETVYALAWAGGLVDTLAGDVPDTLVEQFPHVEEDGREAADAFRDRVALRPRAEIEDAADALDDDTRIAHERRTALDWLLER